MGGSGSQAAAREAGQAAETGTRPSAPCSTHPCPSIQEAVERVLRAAGEAGVWDLAWGSRAEPQVGGEELGGCGRGRLHSGTLGRAGEWVCQQLTGARSPPPVGASPRRGNAGGGGGSQKGKG